MRPSRRHRFRYRAKVARIPAGADPEARETVVANLPCSAVYPLSEQEKERAGMASNVRAVGVFCQYDEEIDDNQHQRVIVDDRDYRLHLALPWPQTNPAFIQLILRDED